MNSYRPNRPKRPYTATGLAIMLVAAVLISWLFATTIVRIKGNNDPKQERITQLEKENAELKAQVGDCKQLVHEGSKLIVMTNRAFYLASEALFGAAEMNIIRIDKATQEMAQLKPLMDEQNKKREALIEKCRYQEGENAGSTSTVSRI